MVFYLVGPFLSIAGRPLIRFDVLAGRADLFGLVFQSNDAAYVVFVLGFLAVLLFLVTALRGRLWCGYACPQTVFIDWLLRPIEELIEGKAYQRSVQNSKPMTMGLFARKTLKHLIFLFISAVVANAFLAYFIPPDKLLNWIVRPPSEHPVAFGFMMAILLAFYLDLAWFREQFCSFVCPYARFQSVMIDRDTPAVAYDVVRGEPRGKASARANDKMSPKGDCIDCGLCVRVCPTGIDIRNGLQLECIMCERCIDACDTIMRSVKKPEGLIRVASHREIERDRSSAGVRFRVWIYASMLALIVGGAAFAVFSRKDLKFTLVRAPRTAFVKMPDGRINNLFFVHVNNNRATTASLDFDLVSPTDAEILCGACKGTLPPFGESNLNVAVMFRGTPGHDLTFAIRHKETGVVISAPLLQP